MKLNTNNVSLKISAGQIRQFPADRLPQVAFSGRSNVGKSSLINSLLGRNNLARVSGTPGKTIVINFFDIDRKMYLVDLPGYGCAKRALDNKAEWSALTDGYFTKNPNIDSLKLVCQLVDSRTGPTSDDLDMLYYLNECGIDHIIVATKVDKLNATEKRQFGEMIAAEPLTKDAPLVMYWAKSHLGRDELWKYIFSSCKI